MLDKVTKFRLERFIDYLDEKDSRVKGLRVKFDDNCISIFHEKTGRYLSYSKDRVVYLNIERV